MNDAERADVANVSEPVAEPFADSVESPVMDNRELLTRRALIHAASIDELPITEIRSVIDKYDFVIIRGLFSEDEIREARDRMREKFSSDNDRKHDPSDSEALRRNFQKVTIGGTAGPNACPRVLRMFYTPFLDNDIYGLHGIFKRLTQLRNLLYGLPRMFTCNGDENGMWTAARINHYPTGGGFMAGHIDAGTAVIAKEAGLERYLQLLLLFSRKGEDFKNGGAYIDYKGQKVFIEDYCKLGDVVIYDGRIWHGVEDIDPLEPFDLTKFSGRFAAFVTLFRRLTPNTNEYSKYT